MTSSSSIARRRRERPAEASCGACAHFANAPALLEQVYRGLTVMGSAYAATRAADGLCARHDIQVPITDCCGDFTDLQTPIEGILMTLDATDDAETATEAADAGETSGLAAAAAHAQELAVHYAGLDGAALLRPLIERNFRRRLAVVSSFGAEAAVILALVAEIDRDTPVLFIDTGKLFGETLRYRDRLTAHLGLREVRTLVPEPARLAAVDRDETLWLTDPDACCAVRKVEPLQAALRDVDAWVSGRKRYHGGSRAKLPVFEWDAAGRIKINPLAGWSKARVDAEFAIRGLPRHPLEAEGYLSIGCMTCTDRVRSGEELRAGRWRGLAKTECGLHWPASVRLDES